MADTYTTNLNLTKPEPGAAEDTWGISLNSDLDTLDAIFSTTGTQVNLNPNQVNFADDKKAIFGSANSLKISHDGTDALIQNAIGDFIIRNTADDKDIILQSDNGSGGLVAYITLDGSEVHSVFSRDAKFTDGIKAKFGNSEDLQIYHTGTQNYIEDAGSGNLNFKSNGNNFNFLDGSDNLVLQIDLNSATKLYHNKSEKLATTSDGIDVTGTVTSDGLTVEGLSLASETTAFSTTANSSNVSLKIGNSDTTSGSGNYKGALGFTRGDSNQVRSAIVGKQTASSNNVQGLAFLVHPTSVAATLTEALLIKANNDIIFYDDTGTSENMVWDASAESLGIGTTSPQKKLNVFADGTAPVRFERNTSHGQVIQIYKDGAAISSIGTNSTGIGTSVPHSTARLHIQGNDGASGSTPNVAANELFVDNAGNTGVTVGTTNTGTGYYAFADSDTALRAGMFYDHSTDDMGFRVASATAITIDSSRNVGVGLTSLTEKFEVNGSINTSNQSSSFTTGNYRTFMDMINSSKIARIGTLKGANTPTDSQGSIYFTVNGATRAVLDRDGNFLVGTTTNNASSEGVILRERGDVRAVRSGGTAGVFNRLTNDGGVIAFQKDGTTVGSIGTKSSELYIGSTTGNDAFFKFGYGAISPSTSDGANSDNYIDLGKTTSRYKDLHLGNSAYVKNIGGTTDTDTYINFGDAANVMKFFTGGSERARIDSSGNFLVNKTGTGVNQTGFQVEGNKCVITNDGDNTLILNRQTSDGVVTQYRKDGTTVGSVQVSSSATTYNTSSDARLKDVTGKARGLEVITKLNPVAYNWKADGKADEGLIAQEVKEIVPNAVSGSENEHYQMDYSKLVTPLVKAVQEQQEQIESLKSEIAKLKGE